MKKVWDRMGIAFSSACVVHCIMVAFLPLFFPALAQITHQPWVHMLVGFSILFTSPLAFIPGFKKHGLTWIMAVAVAGLTLIAAGMMLERLIHSEQLSHGISILGSVLLVVAHFKNIQHSHRHLHQCC
ncbi:MAG TPA: MerC domain-containing protein [Bacteriovoracaceae bacterium]|nr:MerC domain-containing protein [Bacteriovoracaceae bacterium]